MDVDILLALLWELSGGLLDADAACSHFDAGCAAVQAGDVNYEDASLLQSTGGGRRERSSASQGQDVVDEG